jgi:ribosomal protein L34E
MSERDLEVLENLVPFREGLVKLRVEFGNRIGVEKEGGRWVFRRRYSLCENKHVILLKKDEKRDRCPICGKPVNIIEETPSEDLIQRFYDLLKQQETVERLIAGIVARFPEFTNFLAFIKGIGPANAARLILYAYPSKFEFNVNKFRKYAGLAVMFQCPKCGYYYYAGESSDGKPAIPSKDGWLCPNDGTKLVGTAARNVRYNRTVKTFLLGILATNLRLAGGIYAKIIKSFEKEVESKHPDWPKLKIQRTANRKAISLLLAQFYAVSLHYRKGVPLHEAYKWVLGKEYEKLKNHSDFIEAPITDALVGNTKSVKYKEAFEKTIKELGINRGEVIEWLKKKKIIE